MKILNKLLFLSLVSTTVFAQEAVDTTVVTKAEKVSQSFSLNNGYPTFGVQVGSFLMIPDEQSVFSSFGSKTGSGYNAYLGADLCLPLPNKFTVDFGGDVLLANAIESSGITTNSLTVVPRIKLGYRVPLVSNIELAAKFGVGVSQTRVYSEDNSGNTMMLQSGSASWGTLSLPLFSSLQANLDNGMFATMSFQQFFMADPIDGVVSSKYSGDWTIMTGVGYNISIPALGIPQEEIGKSHAVAMAERRRQLKKDSTEKAKFEAIESDIEVMRDSLQKKNDMIISLIQAMDEFEAKTNSKELMPKIENESGSSDQSSKASEKGASKNAGEARRDDVSTIDREYLDVDLDGGFYMVLGSFRNEKYANNFLETLQNDYDLSASLVKVGGGNVRVVLGPFETWTEASKRLRELRTGGRRAWILEIR